MMTSSNGIIFPCYWPFVRGIHRSPVNSLRKGQWRGALLFFLICAWINGSVNSHEAGDLRRHRAHYDVIVMQVLLFAVACHAIYNLSSDFNHDSISHEKHQCIKLMTNHKNFIEIISMEISPRQLITYSKESKQKRVVCMQKACLPHYFMKTVWPRDFYHLNKIRCDMVYNWYKANNALHPHYVKASKCYYEIMSWILTYSYFSPHFYCFSVHRFNSITMTTLFSIISRFLGKQSSQVVPSMNSFIVHVVHKLVRERRNSRALAMGCVFLALTQRYDNHR